jgi:hypothetical protein
MAENNGICLKCHILSFVETERIEVRDLFLGVCNSNASHKRSAHRVKFVLALSFL